jgi:putative lipase involved disintegration of autophagic bodies
MTFCAIKFLRSLQVLKVGFKFGISAVTAAAPGGLATAHLLGLWVGIPPGACMSVVSAVCWHVEVSASADHSSRAVLSSAMCL